MEPANFRITYDKIVCYLLTQWSRVLPEKLKRPKLLKKSPAFYGTRRFITVFTRARHMSLSWARSIQSVPPHPTSRRSILILSSHLLIPRLLAMFRNMINFYGGVSTSPKPQAGGPPHVGCPRLLIQYIHSYPAYLEAVPPSAIWGRAMTWWQGPTYHGLCVVNVWKLLQAGLGVS